ncbi:nucleolar protein 9 isoform X1 [Ambystoma mexicanum]|uniref:nucleolar protein 9 isoform X1 n=1 Tax=Ambystoma mexicanum TaxID=8296 RepID=UPI0037E98684
MGVKKKKSEEKAKNTLRSPESRLPQQESSKAEKSRLKKQTKALKLTKSTPAEDPCGEEAVDEQISSPKNKHPGGNTSAETDQKAIKEKYPPRLDPKSIGYFRRVDDTLQQKFDSEEEKRLFVKNVFGEVKENEVSLAMDITGSLVLQKLLALAQPLQLGQFLSALSKDFFSICCHRSGAHIVQTTLLQFPRLQALSHLPEENAEEEDEEAVTNTLEDLILMLCTDVKGRFLEYTQNTHGSFVVRTLFQVLGGTLLNQEKSRRGPPGATISKKKLNTSSTQAADFAVPESFLAQLQDLTGCFQEDISLFVTNKIASLGLQVALQVLHRKLPMVCSVLCDDVIRYLASRNPSAAGSPLSMYLKDQTTSRLLERIIEVSGKKQLKKLFKSQFQGQLLALSAHAIANFTVQRLITAMPSKKLFMTVFDELSPGVEEVMAKGHMGVVTALVSACRKHASRQAEMMARLMEAFHCLEPASRQIACSPLFLSLLSYEVYYGYEDGNSPLEHQAESERCLGDVNFHGSLLLQQLLHFTDPSPVLLSLAAMMEKDLVTLACSQAGSHVFDALLISDSIPEKKKKKVLRKLKGHYIKLACNKHGSRVLDRIWNAATLGVKQEMAQELASKEQELLKDQFGYHIVRNFALSHFLKRRRDWDEHQVAENKRRKMFAEILED